MPDATLAAETWSVVVWNLDEGRARKTESWAILDGMRADIALLSEARKPKTGVRGHIMGGERTLGRDGKVRSWASAIVSAFELSDPVVSTTDEWGHHRAPLSDSRPGSWTAALVRVPDLGDVTAVSIYGLLDERSDASVHRSLSDLTPLLEDERRGQAPASRGGPQLLDWLARWQPAPGAR